MSVIRTDWFPGTVKPACVGVYERDLVQDVSVRLFSKWDGEKWLDGDYTPESAERSVTRSDFQESPWRGVVPEVHGCVPVEDGGNGGCEGCAFIGRYFSCCDASEAISCAAERIHWHPRSEVAK